MSLASHLNLLQWKQLQHDEKYHKDIWLLSVHHRMNHMVLHFAKYSGKLSLAAYENNEEQFSRVMLDALIISMSAANILNIDLAKEFKPHINKCQSLYDLGSTLKHDFEEKNIDMHYLSRSFSILTGIMAKACESIDHLEAYSFRESLAEKIVEVFELCLTGIIATGIDNIEIALEERFMMVEKKSAFFEILGNYKDNY